MLETAQNSLPLLLSACACLFALYIASRSTPWALNRQLKGWDSRLDTLERDWNRFYGDMNTALEQLEQLDATIKKGRQKVTQERVRLEQGSGPPAQQPGSLHDLRKRAGMVS